MGAQLARLMGDLYYWREGNTEVDFVYKLGRKVFGIEVKSGRKKSAKGLTTFKEKFPDAKVIIITPESYQEFENDPEKFLLAHSM